MSVVETRVNAFTSIIWLMHIDDELPIHTHGENDNHTTTVALGSFEDMHTGTRYRAGDVIVWAPNVPHGFRALEDGTKLVNSRSPGGVP